MTPLEKHYQRLDAEKAILNELAKTPFVEYLGHSIELGIVFVPRNWPDNRLRDLVTEFVQISHRLGGKVRFDPTGNTVVWTLHVGHRQARILVGRNEFVPGGEDRVTEAATRIWEAAHV